MSPNVETKWTLSILVFFGYQLELAWTQKRKLQLFRNHQPYVGSLLHLLIPGLNYLLQYIATYKTQHYLKKMPYCISALPLFHLPSYQYSTGSIAWQTIRLVTNQKWKSQNLQHFSRSFLKKEASYFVPHASDAMGNKFNWNSWWKVSPWAGLHQNGWFATKIQLKWPYKPVQKHHAISNHPKVTSLSAKWDQSVHLALSLNINSCGLSTIHGKSQRSLLNIYRQRTHQIDSRYLHPGVTFQCDEWNRTSYTTLWGPRQPCYEAGMKITVSSLLNSKVAWGLL